MAQSHRYCDHEPTKSARAKCRREREQFGTDYTDPGYGAGNYQPPPRQRSYSSRCTRCGAMGGTHASWCSRHSNRSRTFPRFNCCGNYEAAGHTPWCANARPDQRDSSGHRGGSRSAWDDLFGTILGEPKIVDNENGGWMIQNRGKDREDFARDDAQRDPTRRRIVQLERKAASTTAHEAKACMAAARRLREAAGLLHQAI